MKKLMSIHTRELPVAAEDVGALLDGLGSPGDRLWPADRWPTTPLEIDGPLAVGAHSRQGVLRLTQIRQVVDDYVPGRRLAFRFAPGLGLVGWHSLEVESLGEHRCRLTHTLDAHLELRMIPVSPILIRQHDALAEDLLDRAEQVTTGRAVRSRWPASVRIANALELAVARRRGVVPAGAAAPVDGLTRFAGRAVPALLLLLAAAGPAWAVALSLAGTAAIVVRHRDGGRVRSEGPC